MSTDDSEDKSNNSNKPHKSTPTDLLTHLLEDGEQVTQILARLPDTEEGVVIFTVNDPGVDMNDTLNKAFDFRGRLVIEQSTGAEILCPFQVETNSELKSAPFCTTVVYEHGHADVSVEDGARRLRTLVSYDN